MSYPRVNLGFNRQNSILARFSEWALTGSFDGWRSSLARAAHCLYWRWRYSSFTCWSSRFQWVGVWGRVVFISGDGENMYDDGVDAMPMEETLSQCRCFGAQKEVKMDNRGDWCCGWRKRVERQQRRVGQASWQHNRQQY